MAEILRLENIRKSYPSPNGDSLVILSSVNLSLNDGETVSVIGRSGSGKSTLLAVAALLSQPDSGDILYRGGSILALDDKRKAEMRQKNLGFIFQSSLLLADFSALENTAMPLMISGMRKREAFERASEILDTLGLKERKNHRPSALSGGERQRTAVARALVTSPDIVFADEPTGALDEKSAAEVEEMLLDAVRKGGHSMLLVTHNSDFASRADRMLTLSGGILHE